MDAATSSRKGRTMSSTSGGMDRLLRVEARFGLCLHREPRSDTFFAMSTTVIESINGLGLLQEVIDFDRAGLPDPASALTLFEAANRLLLMASEEDEEPKLLELGTLDRALGDLTAEQVAALRVTIACSELPLRELDD